MIITPLGFNIKLTSSITFMKGNTDKIQFDLHAIFSIDRVIPSFRSFSWKESVYERNFMANSDSYVRLRYNNNGD